MLPNWENLAMCAPISTLALQFRFRVLMHAKWFFACRFSTVLAHEAEAVVSSVSAVVDTDGVIPHHGEILEGIDRLQ